MRDRVSWPVAIACWCVLSPLVGVGLFHLATYALPVLIEAGAWAAAVIAMALSVA